MPCHGHWAGTLQDTMSFLGWVLVMRRAGARHGGGAMRARSFVVSQITGASAAGSLPDALAAVSLGRRTHLRPTASPILTPPEVLNELATSTETMNRRRFPKARAGWSAPSLPPCPSPRSWPPPSTAPSRRPPRPSRPRPTSSRSPSQSPEPAPAHRLCGGGNRPRRT
jgi:hypothetical protein